MAGPEASAAGALARCTARICADPALAARLARAQTFAALREALLAELDARAEWADADLLATLDPAHLQPALAPAAWTADARRGWRPFALEWGFNGAELVWGCGDVDRDAPFHEADVAALRARPFNRCFAQRTPLTPEWIATLERSALPVAGMLLHLSRCGSTLVAQTLKAWPGTRVLAEPALLDTALLAALAGHDPDGWLLRGVVAALCQPDGVDAHVILKLDAWHALALGELRERLPHVPWLFVFRDPLEVLVSHAREPGRHTVPGMLPEAWLPPLAEGETPMAIDHAARVLGAICAAVVPHARAANLVAYEDLLAREDATPPRALAIDIPRHFGLDPAGVDARRLAAALAVHAKHPGERFEDDRAAKRAAATDAIRDAAARWMAPHVEALQKSHGSG